jgi:uncharacterized repeat protein (TIGR02543 family)
VCSSDLNPVEPVYTVTYEGNGSTGGSVPLDNNSYNGGDKVTVLGNTGNLVRDGYTFKGWATSSNATTAMDNTFTINSDTTLYAVWSENSGTWALANLILCIIGALVAVGTIAIVFMRKLEKRYLWLITAAVMGIAGIIVYLVTQDMSKAMVMVDWWTIAIAATLIAGVIATVLSLKGNKNTTSR